MNKPPSDKHNPAAVRPAGIVFLCCGVVFLTVGAGTGLATFLTMAPAFIALGIVFLASSRRQGKG